jgi:thiol-disulfide isomerase/thioredoxin
MEPWKIGVIAALFVGIIGYGAYQQNMENGGGSPTPVPTGTPTPSPLIGKTPPAWNIPAPSDWVNTKAPITLPLLKGHVSVVEIFRTECPHCQDAAPTMEMLSKYYGAKGVKFVGLQSPGQYNDPSNPENNWKTVQQWLKEKGVQYPIGFDRGSTYFQGTFPGSKDSKLYPTMFILTPDGRISFFQTGFDAQKAMNLVAGIEKQIPGDDLDKRLKAIAQKLAKTPDFATTGAAVDQIVEELKRIMAGQKEAK